ncbi:hypothetical protein ACEWA0_07350 [Vibrio parahaemolyticus]|nr:hypothetical protein [Vibrio alginolyticus]MDF4869854.1 hypothetical protein [Vibrio parahaemolyticus]EJS0370826.1 hypothetical protein [Vibrio alginolyticus]EKA3120435.1 hypothetical protein [Vibrio alginolyticus]MCS0253581.1 hypothetical protein [Vibrio alginolyticus]MDG2787270.1 hypothetical protein [Vibrio parahaemolyticus]
MNDVSVFVVSMEVFDLIFGKDYEVSEFDQAAYDAAYVEAEEQMDEWAEDTYQALSEKELEALGGEDAAWDTIQSKSLEIYDLLTKEIDKRFGV